MNTSTIVPVRAMPGIVKYQALAERAHAFLVRHMPAEEQVDAGGYFALTEKSGVPYVTFRVGNPPAHKVDGRLRRSLEKPLRAARCGHKTSFESRDPAKDQWGGALWGDLTDVRGGFSGYPEPYDDIITADVLVAVGDMSADEALVQLKPNQTFQSLKHLFHWAGPRLV